MRADATPAPVVDVTSGPERVAPPPEGTLRWIDLEAQDAAQLTILEERFHFHPLALEDCANFGQRPKLEEYDGHIFIVTQGFTLAGEAPVGLEVHELHAFLGKGWLVTVHEKPLAPLEDVWKRAALGPALVKQGLDFVYHQIADAMVDQNFPILDRISDELEEIEDCVLGHSEPTDLARIFAIKRSLVTMRKVLAPQRDVIGLLTKRGNPLVSERTTLYLRDVYDHLVRIHESIETGRDLLGNALDAHLTVISNRTNEIMKRLTIMSAIFLPLTFVTGFFGQNFEHLPFKDDRLLFAMLASCVILPSTMLWWFRRSRWI